MNTYFHVDRNTKLITDGAKGVGIGGILMQETQLGWKAILFVSRALKLAEKNYSQTEVEVLAISW